MNGTLFIQKVAEVDEGKYLCEADNGVNEPLGQVVSLKVNGEFTTSTSTTPISPEVLLRTGIFK